MIDFEEIKKQILQGKLVEDILEKFDWRNFEKSIAEIFKENNFKVKQNFRFKTSRRYEIDILAVRENTCLCVDCKEWSRGRYKKSGLKQAVKQQENRVKQLKKFMKKNLIGSSKVYPLIVTLLEEDLIKEDSTFIVPVSKLNSFLTEFETYT